MKTIVSVSGGLSSAYALKRVIETEGRENVIAIFADVKGTGHSHTWSDLPELEYLLHERYGGESPDTYRFLWELSYGLDIPIERIEDGRSIWAVFAETRSFRLYSGGRFVCKASELLKREVIANWLTTTLEPGTYKMALGMGVFEGHRVHNAQKYWRWRLGWDIDVYSPLIDEWQGTKQVVDNCVINQWLLDAEIGVPNAYANGMQHNNCFDKCVHAGQSQRAAVYRANKESYLYDAWQEMRLRNVVGIDATIMRDERGGVTTPMSLYEFAERVERGDVNERDLGGSCSCFTTTPEMAAFMAAAERKPTTKEQLKLTVEAAV
jgi:hypothetical protein